MKFDLRKPRNHVEFVCEDGVKKSAKIHYVFDDGTTSVVEVDVPTGEFINVQFREEENANRKERYWIKFYTSQLEGDGEDDDSDEAKQPKLHEGLWLADKGPTPSEQLELDNEQAVVNQFLATLTEVQRRRLQYRLDDPDISLREISRLEGVSYSKIHKTFDQIQEKYKKFFQKNCK